MDEPEPQPQARARRWPLRLALAAMTTLAVLGPWPVDDPGFEGSAYQSRTLDRLDASPRCPASGPIRVGLAEVDLTPETPRPLAGFIGQVRTPYVGVDTPCFARALTIESTSGAVTILTADLLLIDARLAKAACDRAGVRPDQVYFTASHTHGGPGGWGDHPLEMLVAGAYDPVFFDRLAGQLGEAMARSRQRLDPAEMAFLQARPTGRQVNRVDRSLPTHDALSALAFRPLGAAEGSPPLAILTSFGAHATVSHPVPPRLGGDYPAALASELKRATGARSVLFAAGAVGDASPARPKAASPFESSRLLGAGLAGDLAAALPSARYEREIVVGNLRLDVDLPPVRIPFFSSRLRFSPLATCWVADRRTHLHALRLGPAVLLGFPGDYSGHLADRLDDLARPSGLAAVATSFDGDFRGYLVSGAVFFRKSCYETRLMNFYGPWAGDYLNDLASRMADRLSDNPRSPARPKADASGVAPAMILAAFLAASAAIAWRKRSEVPGLVGRAGYATTALGGLALLAVLVAPDLTAWATFGLPVRVRLLGLPLGLVALLPWSRARSGRAGAIWATALVLLSSSWVFALMAARGWAKWGLSSRANPTARSASGTPESGRGSPTPARA